MALFIMFIVGAVLLGAGAMLAPAWKTHQPRIALAATLALALVSGGAVFSAFLFSWDTLVVDYLLFLLVSVVVLGGTLSQAQVRAEAKGEKLEDHEQGWTGPEDLLFFAVVGVVIIAVIFIMTLPTGVTGISLAYQTLTLRLSAQFDSLAPFHPTTTLLQPPGFIALTAYLSKQLEQSPAIIQFSVGGVLSFLCVWLAYDWGSELRDKRLGRAFAVVCIASGGVLLLLTSGQYTALMATTFGFALAIYTLRVARHQSWWDVVAGGLMLGAIFFADFAVGLLALVGVLAWLTVLVVRQKMTRVLVLRYGALFLVTLVGMAPWLLKNIGRPDPLIYFSQWTVWGWLILPLTCVGGYALLLGFERISLSSRGLARRNAYALMLVGALVGVALTGVYSLDQKSRVTINADDVAVLQWMDTHLPSDAKVMNYRADDWASALSEHATRVIPVWDAYQNTAEVEQDSVQATAFWNDPQNLAILRDNNIGYVYKPSDAPDLSSENFTVLFEQGQAKVVAVK